jgi:hypothetical protein
MNDMLAGIRYVGDGGERRRGEGEGDRIGRPSPLYILRLRRE